MTAASSDVVDDAGCRPIRVGISACLMGDVPLTLLRHYVRRFDVAYLAGQTYLQPHPKELMLRNHV